MRFRRDAKIGRNLAFDASSLDGGSRYSNREILPPSRIFAQCSIVELAEHLPLLAFSSFARAQFLLIPVGRRVSRCVRLNWRNFSDNLAIA